MMILSSFVILQLSIVILFMTTFINATNISPPTAMVNEISQSSDDEINPTAIFHNRHFTLEDLESAAKPLGLTGDDGQSDEGDEYDYSRLSNYEAMWPQDMSKRYTKKVARGGSLNGNGGDSRLWAIPYRFGKRAAMPYRFADTHGGVSSTVDAVGGFLQGNGHGPLSRWKCLASDQVLEYDVVTANGQRETVSPYQNGDLFWALSGGGRGNYAIVLSAVLRTFPSPQIVGMAYSINAPNEACYARLIGSFIRLIPILAEARWSDFFSIADMRLSAEFNIPNGDLDEVSAIMNQFTANNSDLDFRDTNISVFSSFYHYASVALEPINMGGFNNLMSSRLIPESIIRNESDKVAEVFVQAKGRYTAGSNLAGYLVAGVQVLKTSNTKSSVNPAWRTAPLHMVFSQVWIDLTPEVDQTYIATLVSRQGEISDKLSVGSRSGCYMNEADPNEVNWQEKFFGSQTIYNRLKSIKETVDLDGLFVCKNCVGSDDWKMDLNCSKTSLSMKLNLTILLLVIEFFAVL
ncbi:unnamed protein product [Rotaria magnacalcarata]|uniref:Berberine/berberine-like domain-containing protein n=2 Tax=Rotaria magnacalcarata TaxID=392030 RepID=A0A819RVB8_9BILA|nr:unnamed protein product [Rotaria magnacalcarata]CAF3808903.1 unnamed protein product [Rotaria magnacalcarata]CAF4049717.1 unnamed protein product [Rotaria magnacalcarata]